MHFLAQATRSCTPDLTKKEWEKLQTRLPQGECPMCLAASVRQLLESPRLQPILAANAECEAVYTPRAQMWGPLPESHPAGSGAQSWAGSEHQALEGWRVAEVDKPDEAPLRHLEDAAKDPD